jgi:stage II sporulation protein M
MKSFIFKTAVVLSFLFFISAYAGFHLADEFPQIKEMLERFFSQFKGYIEDPPMFMAILLANNAGKSFVAMIGGFFFGILPVAFILINGFIVGIVVSFTQPELGSQTVLLAILPHGVFEITGVIIACSYGVWLGVRFYYSLFRGEEFLPYLKEALYAYFRIVLPLLILAAFIEAFITPALVKGYIT